MSDIADLQASQKLIADRSSLAADVCARFVPQLLMILISGVLLALCYPRVGWSVLTWVALVPLAWAVGVSQRPVRLVLMVGGMLLAWWLLMQYWLIQVTVGGWIGLSGISAFYATLGVAVAWWLVHRKDLPLVWALPLGWVTFELVRCTFPFGGYSWFLLAQSQAAWREGDAAGQWVQVVDLAGPWTLSFLIAMFNGLLADFLLAYQRVGKACWPACVKQKSVWVAVVLLISAWGYGLYRVKQISQTLELGPHVAVIQTNIPQDNKTRPTMEADAMVWNQLISLTSEAVQAADEQGITLDAVIWPETSVPAPINMQGAVYMQEIAYSYSSLSPNVLQRFDAETRNRLKASAEQFGIAWEELPAYYAQWFSTRASYRSQIASLAREHNVMLLVGSPTRKQQPISERFNSVYQITADGQYTRRYDKIHRVPFGEYLPLVELVPWLRDTFVRYMTPYDEDYTLTQGRDMTVFAFEDGMRVAAPICFEDTVSRLCLRMVFAGMGERRADVMVNVTNDGWYPGTTQGPQHFQIAVLRSVETRTPMVRSVNTGVSGLIDPSGRIPGQIVVDGQTQQVSGYAIYALPLATQTPLFAYVRTWPAWGMAVLTLWLVIRGYRRRAKMNTQV